MTYRIRGILTSTVVIAGALALTGLGPPSDGVSLAHFAPVAADTGRPVVILVHGRGQLLGDSAAVHAQWSRVLQSGASKLAGASLLRDEDVWLAWYADALDPLAPPACSSQPGSDSGQTPAEHDADGTQALFAAMGESLVAALDLFDGYARDEARAIAGDLLFLGDPQRRCAAETQLEAALARAAREKRPVILVAHSFGSLLAYGYLHSASPDDSAAIDVRRFVTIGSLLGAPGARELLLGDREPRASLPPGVQAWTNIVEPEDALAYPIAFSGDTAASRLENLTTTPGTPGADPHDVVRYLRDPVTVRVVTGAWCEAFETASGCHRHHEGSHGG
jgi:alpha-beta hydrolase superfamily lysophospholipase